MAATRGRRPSLKGGPRPPATAAVVPVLAVGFYFLLPLVFTTAGLDTFRLPKAMFAAAAIPWIVTAFWLTRRASLKPGWYRGWDGLLVAALAYVVAHTVLVGGWSVGGSAVIAIFLYAALLVVLRASLDRRRQRTVWWALLTALSLDAVLAVLQFYQLLGQWGTDVGRTLGGRFTPAGLIGNVNTGGLLFALGALMLAALAITAASKRERGAALAMLVIQLVALAHTRTITAVVAFLLCAAAGLAFSLWWLSRYRAGRSPARRPAFLWGSIAAVAVLGYGLLSYTGTSARIGRALEHYQNGNYQRFASGRLPLFLTTWRLIEQSPVRGSGLGHFARDFFYFKVENEEARQIQLSGHQGAFREAHNEYLQTWVELGLPGLLLLAALAGWPLWRLPGHLSREEDPHAACWTGFLALSFLALLVGSLSFFPLHIAVTAAVAVLLLACLLRQLDESAAAPARTGSELWTLLRSPRGIVTALVLVLLSGWMAFHQMHRWRANTELSIAAGILGNVASGRMPADVVPSFVAEARRRIDRAEAWDPGNHESRPLRGTAAFLAGRYDLAVEAYREAARLAPSPEILTNLAAAHLARDELVEARRSLETALAYNPRSGRAQQALRHLETLESR